MVNVIYLCRTQKEREMIVELKKVKITKSIESQIQISHSRKIKAEYVLGWYHTAISKWMLFYNSDKNELSKYNLDIRTKILSDHKVKVDRMGFIEFIYECKSGSDAIDMENRFNESVKAAIEKGQIFI